MKIKSFLSAISYLCVIVSGFLVQAQGAKPLNVVLIVADDLGAHDLKTHGSDLHETPHLDGFAASGIEFTSAYAAAPICTPTRASIMTGKNPARLRMTIWSEHALRGPKLDKPMIPADSEGNLPLEEITLAERFKEAGYHTFHIGKWHLGEATFYPEVHGFDVNIGGSYIGAPGSYYHPYYRKPGGASGPVENLPPGGPQGRYLTDRLTDEAVRLIGEGSDRPFFLYLSYYSVHTPIQPRPDLRDRYANQLKPGKLHKNADYAAMVAAVDESVGRVMRRLEETGRAGDTIIVFTSDNGGMHKVTANAPLRGGKGMAWEGGTRVPLIIKSPGMTSAGRTSREPVISPDFYPTLLELTQTPGDATHNRNVDGVSLTPLLRDPSAELKRDAIYWHYPHYNVLLGVPHTSLRSGRYKLIEFFEGSRVELYDLRADIGEQKNLAGSLPDKTASLLKRLHAWRTEIGAQMPVPIN